MRCSVPFRTDSVAIELPDETTVLEPRDVPALDEQQVLKDAFAHRSGLRGSHPSFRAVRRY